MIDSTFSPNDILKAYRCGLFPMADNADAEEFFWYDPPQRGQLSIPRLHIPRRLRHFAKKFPFDIRVDTDFAGVIDACAQARDVRPKTWINAEIRNLFIALHDEGHAHSVECWKDGALVGGLYGLAFGGVFAGESMFSHTPNASKIALIHLCARLWRGGFTILDTQFLNPHLMQFGAFEISREDYLQQISAAQAQNTDFILRGLNEADLLETYLAANPAALP